MKAFFVACFSTCFLSAVSVPVSDDPNLIKDESKGVEFLDWYNAEFSKVEYRYRLTQWDYYTNITDHNQKKVVEADVWRSKFVNEAVKNASRYDWRNFRNGTVQRLFRIITDVGWAALSDPKKVKRLSNVSAEMKKIYSEASVCNVSGDHCIDMETGLTPIMANSRDYDTLVRAWKGWRDVTGKQMRTLYTEYVNLMNEGVKQAPGDHSDTGDYLRGWYESPTFQKDLKELLKQLRPLYSQLHAYVRARLQKQHPQHRFPKSGHIPAHILGNMWAQNWENIYHLVQPYKSKSEIDVTSSLKEQNYNATTIFRTAENFFTSLGLSPLPASFWENSMLSKPTDGRSVVCHASAWDMGNSKDFRIKMCTAITMPELIVVHHEMGHIMYDMLYKDQPIAFRDGANPGFHEAIGDLIALSVSTPTHLKELGLLDSAQKDTESDLNFLMVQALRKIAFLPFGYLIDQWRWSVFSGNTTEANYNRDWWDLRCRYQGIFPPVERSEDDFDPGAKYHIPSGTPYIRYFISHILQFQFHKALCQEKGHNGPLHLCDIYNSKAAGDKLKNALKLGASRPWPEVLKMLTGTPKMDAGPMIEYFSPLIEWLKKTNEEEKNIPGWASYGCPSVETGRVRDEEAARQFARDFNDLSETRTSEDVEINWEYNTNITEFNQKQVVSSSVEHAEFKKEMADLANLYDWQLFTDEDLRRLFSKITDIGTAVQGDQDKLAKMNEAQSDMESVYSTANVCLSDGSCHQIEPGLTQLLATSTNYSLLSEAWTLWRDATGPKMKSNYEQLVALSNEAIKLANFSDIGAYWRSWYETATFQEDLEKLLNELKPLYENLHAYVRRKLKQVYDSDKDKFPTSGHIPAHLLGNMWGQQWNNIAKYVLPYPDKEGIDVTPKLKEKGYNAKKLFEISEEFFLSLGLIGMPETFWEDSMITKPTDREVVCHASAWDFYNRKDFRIKMCTEISMEDLITIHHEMGHVEYFLQYKEQPTSFREGANPGFHEAVGDVMALSVSTPEHLHEIGLLDNLENDTETDLNFLMSMALEKIAFLPFGYLIDQWRWSVFSGETAYAEYNKKWWELRCKHQGVSPPVDRTSDDFDPGAKYHVPANVPYIRYFVSFVIQFQFHQALCKEAGKTNVPLHRCDIYRSANAGQKLSDMLKLGSSVSWQEAMEKVTGQREMSAKPLLEYFKPLTDWLEKQNQGEAVGWTDDCPGGGRKRSADNTPSKWLREYNNIAQQQLYTEYEVEWNYATNITDENSEKLVDARLKYAKFGKEASQNASRLLREYNSSLNSQERRGLKKIATIGTDALKDEAKLKQLNTLQSEMEGIYGKAKVCVGKGNCLPLEPDIYHIVATSRNYSELELVWKGWRDASGRRMKGKYVEFVSLSNHAIQDLNQGFRDTGDYWRSSYESASFQEDLVTLLGELKPLYKELHTYVRRQLRQLYGGEKFPRTGHIPAHILGNMWAQHWNNIYDLIIPFKNKASVDVTPAMVTQRYNASHMFHVSEEFFTSLGLTAMPGAFWEKSMIVKPDGREVVCHASAWDFYNQKDFRIKMCTTVTMENLITIHHEMGHIQYFLQYKDQPVQFRDGANPGFHEAIGDTMALSVSTPKHLHRIGLLDKLESDNETEINFLMSMALDKIAFLPFGYLIDQWRWSVFSGETTPDKYNQKWWELRCKYQGISPPVERTEEDFDPGAKYHIPDNTPYIRYFVSYVIQFQFHKALCEAAGQTGPLHQCDIYQSKTAGKKLGDMLKLGSSVPWQDAMQHLTGQRKMSAGALMDYFKPLTDWLKIQNQDDTGGWQEDCPKYLSAGDKVAKQWLEEYNRAAEATFYEEGEMEWTYATNITDENEKKLVASRLELAQFEKEAAKNASKLLHSYNVSTLTDSGRQLFLISDIGTSALRNQTVLEKLNTLQSEIEGIYGKAELCLENSPCLSLEPDMYRIMSSSRNYTELQTIWEGWRDVSGKKMKEKYAEFVKLSNQGIQELGLGYTDTGDYWRAAYESDTFQQDLRQLLEQLKPLYQELHTYVRMKLRKLYGSDKFPDSGHIPAHILGNMWAQEWQNLYDLLIPFKGKTNVDITPVLKAKNYTALRMFQTAEDFFTSLGLKAMPQPFWDKSMIVKPEGRDVVCHASAWDFYNRKDFRIKMCTDITMEDLITVHHEMGHIQYYLQYMNQSLTYRNGANPGFHEAIGDTMALSASTPQHLHKIGLLENLQNDRETDLNYLMKMALEKIAFLPFGYLIDQWRWSVFSGETTPDNYNDKWWALRCKYQGISPPVERRKEDFDPGAKYHIPSNTPYIRYFVSFVIQFQFHKALCKEAGQTGPLYQCDIYQSKAAGKKLGDMLKLGSSLPWQQAMEKLTGQRKMDVGPLIEYFSPLLEWLKVQNQNETGGWRMECPTFLEKVDVNTAKQWLEENNQIAQIKFSEETEVEWTYATNITDENAQKQVKARFELAEYEKDSARKASYLLHALNIPQTSIIGRELFKVSDIGTSALTDKSKLQKLNELQSEIEGIYGKARLCVTSDTCLSLDPDMYRIMSTSRNFTELKTVWEGWRDVSGKKMKEKYSDFVKLSNEGVRELNMGYNDTGEYWRSKYESDTFQEDLKGLLEQLKPLYQELHTYVRKELRKQYGTENFPVSGHIPAHLLGNMWAQEWQNIYDLVIPFKNKANVDITPVLKEKKYTALRMFRTAEEFFTSLGLKRMPEAFWNKSMIVKPEGRDVVCHASAWDFYNQKDFRIKMCTDTTMEDLITIHHEMGHIQYYLQYMDQPVAFREGANPGFHEAIGDTMALSVSTPKHLHRIGLLQNLTNDQETDLNFLMKMALEKIAFLPFGYLIDQWRWSVFSGETTPDKYNQKWWELRCKYQGVSPPVARTEEDFDPGAKYHIPSNTPYIRYFVSFVIQFQFHKTLCEAAGQTGPLHQCDIYQSKAAGEKLRNLLKQGSSKPWPDVMKELTGQSKMDVSAILEYFKPLHNWLKEQNKGEKKGWETNCNTFNSGQLFAPWLKNYEGEAKKVFNHRMKTLFDYESNITDFNEQKKIEASLAFSAFRKEAYNYVKNIDIPNIKNERDRRLFEKIADIGTGALKSKQELGRMEELESDMIKIYSTAKVPVSGVMMELEPGLTEVLTESSDYDKLLQVWKGFRDAVGPAVRPMYVEFIHLANKAIRDLGYGDYGQWERRSFDTDTLPRDVEKILNGLMPMYRNLHAYARKKLMAVYGADKFPKTRHIPAHLLGNMWAQKWDNIYRLLQPFKNKELIDVTQELIRQNYTVERMFRTAESFFTSLGMDKMTDKFWNYSLIRKPSNRKALCHAGAFDLFADNDFRIKMCTVKTHESLIIIHHEMGHIQYFMEYQDQPVNFRQGANPGFHEAIGDTISLSVQTPGHLQKIGLLHPAAKSSEADLNFLMKMALEKIAFLPFAFIMDNWRWGVFSRNISPDDLNSKWWQLRCKYQGISPPVRRTENDFDPGAKYHIPANYQYISYFMSYIMQFQFHKALCNASGHAGPLHTCDIYQSKNAGKLLRDMLKLGASVPWPDAMEQITGQRKVDIGPLLEYFQPLNTWLENEVKDEIKDWNDECPNLPPPKTVTQTKDEINSASFTYISTVYLVTGTLVTVLFALLI
ncbi:uncharacterized protein LOC130047084 isoform X2 [Ostrea edulis]|uniref:uncharacterized protein LOC130047084 isoform X2 n=1 Tax=Ostrea edulis TaxID=37623 RepID=UPI0024AF25FC|nr:uncharacterized protein LOC130047084 isoform X2 [Ostrea edulis]